MDKRLEKYYSGFAASDNIARSSAVSAFAALLRGDVKEGAVFKMNSDEFMREHLDPEDFVFWIDSKNKIFA